MVRLLAALLTCALIAGCQGDEPTAQRDATESPAPTRAPASSPPSTPTNGDLAPSGSPEEAGLPGVTAAQLRQARRTVRRMSLAEMAGQVVVAAYSGNRPPVELVTRHHLAGVIVFTENVSAVASLRRDIARLQRADRRPWPLFVGVDQEGGVVTRVGSPLTPWPTLMSHGAAGRPDLARSAAAAAGAELRAAGFTAVFAPVADVTSGPADPTIGSRSAGASPTTVARVVEAQLAGFAEAGILPVVKHFPGHGSVPADSHVELPIQAASLRTLWRRDLLPFRRGVEQGAPAVMVAHIDLRVVDAGMPASVSRPVVTGLLRERIGFGGLVVTDSLQMAGLTSRFGGGEAAVRALRAGADLLLMPADPVETTRAVTNAVREGRLPRRRLADAATRVAAHLLHVGARAAPGPRIIGAHRKLSHAVSAAAITVTDGACRGRLVGGAVSVFGDYDAVAAFERAAAEAGLDTSGGDTVALIGYGGEPVAADVVVATDTPYVLGGSRAPVKIATYGSTPGAMRALVDVLLGRAAAPGRLPVPVPGLARTGC